MVKANEFNERLQKGIMDGCEEVAKTIRETIYERASIMKGYGPDYYQNESAPIFDGALINSMTEVEPIENGFKIHFPLAYTSYIEDGTDTTVGHEKESNPKFYEWLEAKGLLKMPNKSPIGKAHPFIKPAVDYVFEMAPQIIGFHILKEMAGTNI